MTNKKALFRVVKIETPELGVRSLGSCTKPGSTPPLDKVTADDQLTNKFRPWVVCYLGLQKCHPIRTILAGVSGYHLLV